MPSLRVPSRKEIYAESIKIAVWMNQHLRIIDKQGNLVPLVLNDEQQKILWILTMQRLSGNPVRLIVLKARKIGCSTFFEGEMYRRGHCMRNRRGLVCAQTDDDSRTLFHMTRLFHEENPAKRPLKTSRIGARELDWRSPHRSRLSVQTAGKVSLARGDTVHDLHCSEIPHWPHAKQTLLSVLNAVPDVGNNMVILESTARGYEEFKDRWDAAVAYRKAHKNDLTGWIPIFFSWLHHKHYRAHVPPGYDWGSSDEYEEELRGAGATPQQLYWRRLMLADRMGGDPDLFSQEMPYCPEIAFLASGRRAISPTITNYHRSLVRPGKKYRLRYGLADEIVAEEGDWGNGYWEVFESPKEFCDYAIGADIAEGKVSDSTNPASDPDKTQAFVLNRRHMTQAARWEGAKISENDIGRELIKCGKWYNDAWLSPEINNTGKATLLTIVESGYQNLYRRHKAIDSVKSGDERGEWGWRTTSANREAMIAAWIDACRQDANPDNKWRDKIQVFSKNLVDEEETLVWTQSNRREHSKGKHDDELFASCIALQIHLQTPRQNERIAAFDYEPPTDKAVLPPPSYMFAGGKDDRRKRAEEADDSTI